MNIIISNCLPSVYACFRTLHTSPLWKMHQWCNEYVNDARHDSTALMTMLSKKSVPQSNTMILGVGTSEDPRKSTKPEFWPLGVGKSEVPPGYVTAIHQMFTNPRITVLIWRHSSTVIDTCQSRNLSHSTIVLIHSSRLPVTTQHSFRHLRTTNTTPYIDACELPSQGKPMVTTRSACTTPRLLLQPNRMLVSLSSQWHSQHNFTWEEGRSFICLFQESCVSTTSDPLWTASHQRAPWIRVFIPNNNVQRHYQVYESGQYNQHM